MNRFQSILHTARSLLNQDKSSHTQGEQALHEAYRKDMQELDNPQTTPVRTPTPSIGKDNQTLMDSLTKAKKVAITLARAGHRVLDINIGSRNARITLNASPRCNLLGGAMIKITRINGIEEKTMAANIEGVQIEWTTASKQWREFQ